jgi:iron complex outermembrane receptor protein
LKSKEFFGAMGLASGIIVAVAPMVQAQTPVTSIQVRETLAGLEISLETDQEITPQVMQRIEGNRLVLEISDAQLANTIEPFLAPAPIEGIQEITITQLPGDIIQVTLIGETAAPFAEVVSSVSGVAIQVTLDHPDYQDQPGETLEFVVTATRIETEDSVSSQSVTVIDRDQIENQAAVTRDLAEILAKLVPGFSPPTQTTSIFGQTLRGRNISVLIDGVPQGTNRNAQRDLRVIDPGAIEKIEIVRGPSAIYGDGATGGIVNIITRRGATEKLVSRSTVGLDFSATHPEDSVGYTLQHSTSGTQDKLNYIANVALSSNGGFFDADGDRIPPDPLGQGGLADLTMLNLYGKLGYDIDEQQRLQFTVNYFHDRQDTDFALNPDPSGNKAEAIAGLVLPDQPDTKNLVLNLAYTNNDLLGSKVNGQIYYRNYSTRFYPFDDDFGTFGDEVLQSEVESEKIGGRLDIATPILADDRLSLLWGVDYFHEDSAQPADLFDEAAFEASNGLVFNPTGKGFLSPPLTQNSLGLFAQLTWNATDNLVVNGGVRQEFIGVNIDDFTTLAGNSVTGGNLDYSATLFNLGAVYAINDYLNIFGSFSQGFSIADVARVLRTSPAGFKVEDLRPEAQTVDNYELGIRGEWDTVQASIAGFYSYSNLGTTFDANLNTLRDPQRIYGVEADIKTQLSDRLALGGTFTYTEGDRDTNDDGNFDSPLPSFQIPPLKLTGYVEYKPIPEWFNRFQVSYSGNRNPEGDGFGLEPVDGYFTADLISRYDTGFGTIQLGIENLFNRQYYPIISQVYGGRSRYAARGMTLSLSYSLTW